MSDSLSIARAAWGEPLPDWIEVLARECVDTSQNKVAARLGRSASLVSTVLRGTYKGDMGAVEQRVRSYLLNGDVACPRLGNIKAAECMDWRDKARDFHANNMMRVQMFRACRTCPRNGNGDA